MSYRTINHFDNDENIQSRKNNENIEQVENNVNVENEQNIKNLKKKLKSKNKIVYVLIAKIMKITLKPKKKNVYSMNVKIKSKTKKKSAYVLNAKRKKFKLLLKFINYMEILII